MLTAHIPLQRAPDFVFGEQLRGQGHLASHKHEVHRQGMRGRRLHRDSPLVGAHLPCHCAGKPRTKVRNICQTGFCYDSSTCIKMLSQSWPAQVQIAAVTLALCVFKCITI